MHRTSVPHRFAAAVLATVLLGVTAPGCATIESLTESESLGTLTGLSDSIQQVAELTGEISKWSADLSDVVSDPQLEKLGGFASRAVELVDSLQGASDTLGDDSPSGLAEIIDGLGQLGSFNVEDLLSLGGSDRTDATRDFSGIADTLGQLASQFLNSR